jgi:predicted aconitase with swiveling domain
MFIALQGNLLSHFLCFEMRFKYLIVTKDMYYIGNADPSTSDVIGKSCPKGISCRHG